MSVSTPQVFTTLILTPEIYSKLSPFINEIAEALRVPDLSWSFREEMSNSKGLRIQKDGIIAISNFIKYMAEFSDENGMGRLLLYPVHLRVKGYAIYSDSKLTYYPDPNSAFKKLDNTDNGRCYTIDFNGLNSFNDDFIKFLGGLLLDGQTFIVKTEFGMTSNQYLTAFRFFEGSLTSGQIVPFKGSPSEAIDSVPENLQIYNSEFNEDLASKYDSIIAFLKDNNLLFYYTRHRDYSDWIEDCKMVIYIHNLFK